jgi:hypothetical protein
MGVWQGASFNLADYRPPNDRIAQHTGQRSVRITKRITWSGENNPDSPPLSPRFPITSQELGGET